LTRFSEGKKKTDGSDGEDGRHLGCEVVVVDMVTISDSRGQETERDRQKDLFDPLDAPIG
jgi:hypothetical protein